MVEHPIGQELTHLRSREWHDDRTFGTRGSTLTINVYLHWRREVYRSGNCDIVRDARFESLGFLSDPQPSMLVFLESRRFFSTLRRTREATCVITRGEYAGEVDFIQGLAISAEPRLAFHQIHEHLALQTSFYWTDFDTEIDPTASVHPTACVAAGNVRIGPRTSRISDDAMHGH